MPKIVAIDDDSSITGAIATLLENDHEVFTGKTIGDLTRLLETQKPDLVLLDVQLEAEDALDALPGVIAQFHNLPPVVFLTAHTDVEKKVKAFDLGADDYIEKPFNPLELKARVNHRLKKAKIAKIAEKLIVKGPLRLNLLSHSATIKKNEEEKPIELTQNEFRLLTYLIQNENEVVDRKNLIKNVLGDTFVLERTIDTHINKLRKKMGPLSPWIRSVRGAGYKFTMDT